MSLETARTTMPTAETLAELVHAAVKVGDMRQERSQQARSGRIGPSDLGFCRQKTVLVTRATPASDMQNLWPAVVGTALGTHIEEMLAVAFPSWQVGSVTRKRYSHTFPCGSTISGTPDIVIPPWNAVLDLKSKDGFGWVKREPWSQNYLFQVSTYALALLDAGVLDRDRPVTIGLVYIDRSGAIEEPYVTLRLLDPSIEDQIDSWLSDTIYAVLHDEDASRDIPAPVCEQICEFFTVCRGGLPDSEGDLITDPTLVGAVEMYVEGQQMMKESRRLMDEAKGMLVGVEGTTGEYQVRHTRVGEADVPGYRRAGYVKLDVRRQR